jgi:hypothetical protein
MVTNQSDPFLEDRPVRSDFKRSSMDEYQTIPLAEDVQNYRLFS